MAFPLEVVKEMWWGAWGTLEEPEKIAAWIKKYRRTIVAHPAKIRQFLQNQGKAIQQNWKTNYDNEFLMIQIRRRLTTIDIWIEEFENLLISP
jgi:hypothetical protein